MPVSRNHTSGEEATMRGSHIGRLRSEYLVDMSNYLIHLRLGAVTTVRTKTATIEDSNRGAYWG